MFPSKLKHNRSFIPACTRAAICSLHSQGCSFVNFEWERSVAPITHVPLTMLQGRCSMIPKNHPETGVGFVSSLFRKKSLVIVGSLRTRYGREAVFTCVCYLESLDLLGPALLKSKHVHLFNTESVSIALRASCLIPVGPSLPTWEVYLLHNV